MSVAKMLPRQPALNTKRQHRSTRALLLTRESVGARSTTARLFNSMAAAVEADLGGRDQLSRIELECVEGLCGAAVLMRHLNARLVLLKPGEPLDIASFNAAAGALVKFASLLGISKRARDVTPDLSAYLRKKQEGAS